MRAVLLLLMLLLFACTIPKEITKEQTEKIYSHQVNRSSNEIKLKILTYINESFYSGKAVIQTQDEGIITGNYRFYSDDFDLLGMFKVYATATFIIKYKDQSYKTKFVLKDMETVSSKGIVPLDRTFWGNYADEINDNYNRFESTLYEYIISEDTF